MNNIRTIRSVHAITIAFACTIAAAGADRPNIVYIALEDITPMMGCYGDTYAKTPVFDALAAEGIRYTHAYSVGPVCSVSRSSIVTGMYPIWAVPGVQQVEHAVAVLPVFHGQEAQELPTRNAGCGTARDQAELETVPYVAES